MNSHSFIVKVLALKDDGMNLFFFRYDCSLFTFPCFFVNIHLSLLRRVYSAAIVEKPLFDSIVENAKREKSST